MQSPKLVFLVALIATVSVTFSASASTQNQQAQQTLEKALQALGGIERLRNLNSLFSKAKGVSFARWICKGRDPSTPIKHFTKKRPPPFHRRKEFFTNNALAGTMAAFVGDAGCMPVRNEPSSTCRTISSARCVAILTRQQSARASHGPSLICFYSKPPTQTSNLRWIGNQNYNGKPHNVIGFPLPNSKTVLALFFAADTNLLTKYEYTMDFPGLGDTLVEFVYNGYRRDPKLGHAPAGYKILLEERLTARLSSRMSRPTLRTPPRPLKSLRR